MSIGKQIQAFTRRDKVFDYLAKGSETGVEHNNKYLLSVEDLSVSFDGFKAINNLTLYIDQGELRCIIGPNGAGKTTFIDILTGKTRPDSGSAWFGQNHNLLTLTESRIAQLGIGRKFQKPTVFENHTVIENLEMAMAGSTSIWQCYRAKINEEEQSWLDEVLAMLNLQDQLQHKAGSLSHGQKQWLEIGMLLMQKPALLLVDEPVAGMTHAEMQRTEELLKSLAGNHTVIVIEHDMDFVRSIADKVTVLHQGSVLAEGSMDEIQANQKVIDVYLGT